jgi:hypothetical protein
MKAWPNSMTREQEHQKDRKHDRRFDDRRAVADGPGDQWNAANSHFSRLIETCCLEGPARHATPWHP